jgi:hypothetical protein
MKIARIKETKREKEMKLRWKVISYPIDTFSAPEVVMAGDSDCICCCRL